MLRWGRVEVGGGFLFLTALLYYLDADGVLFWCALGAVLHELGHFFIITAFGGRVVRLRLSCVGAEMVLSGRCPLSNWGNLWSALAGPAVNLLVVVVLSTGVCGFSDTCHLVIGLNMALACFNLLPIAQLDGGRVLWHLIAIVCSDWWADRVVGVLSLVLSAVLTVVGGVLLFCQGGTITLLVTALWLLGAAVQKVWPIWRKKGRKKQKNPCISSAHVVNYHSLNKGWSSGAVTKR